MSRIPGHPPPPFSGGDNAGRSSLVWPHFLSVVNQKTISTQCGETLCDTIQGEKRPCTIAVHAPLNHFVEFVLLSHTVQDFYLKLAY